MQKRAEPGTVSRLSTAKHWYNQCPSLASAKTESIFTIAPLS